MSPALVYATTANSTTNTIQISGNTFYNTLYLGGTVGTGGCTYQYPDDFTEWRDAIDIVKGRLALPKERAIVIELADGSLLHVDAQGNYRLDDAKASVIYKASRVREFNPFLNASDLLARFIRDVGTMGVRRGEVATLPLALFVNWLVIEAARVDEDPIPNDVVPVPEHKLLKARVRPRCLVCHRFIRRASATAGFVYCNPEHAARHFARLSAA